MTVLDGLLAASFTTPGQRVHSVFDLLGKQRLDATALQRGLHKVAKSISRWKTLAGRVVPGKEEEWFTDMLDDYDRAHPASPILAVGKSERDINVLMMIDPSFAFSLRSALSDGWMARKTQVTLLGTRYGALLANVGAARFLRAQRLSGDLVNCYVPVASKLTISADTSLPLLFPVDESSEQAALLRWLALSNEVSQPQVIWSGLAYQTLHTQGQQQSLSLESGVLDSGWLVSLQERIGTGVIAFWQALLSARDARDEQESLLDCLKYRSADAWINHLRIIAKRTNILTESNGWRYILEEVRTITEVMNDAENIPLKLVLEREHGTRCFGRALRQIGRYNPSRLRDLLEDLEEVQTRAQLFPVLKRVILASELEKTKEHKIIVPTENDLAALLDDVDQYGIPELVGLLLVLSVLRYPQSDNALKYELSTFIRALIALTVQIGPVSISENDQTLFHMNSLSMIPRSRMDRSKDRGFSNMQENTQLSIYQMSINVLVAWQAHSLSNVGNNGSNRLLPRRQLLADKTETDAISGNITKHHHAALVAEYFAADGSPLCPACRVGDGRRAASLIGRPDYQDISLERIVRECALCDAHGFLVTAKNADSETDTTARQKINKDTLIEFSYSLALPDHHAESSQLHTRVGTSKDEGQMLMKIPARSGEYALYSFRKRVIR